MSTRSRKGTERGGNTPPAGRYFTGSTSCAACRTLPWGEIDFCPLHAATPALLEALEEASQWLEHVSLYGDNASAIRIGAKSQAIKARAAIRAAKGIMGLLLSLVLGLTAGCGPVIVYEMVQTREMIKGGDLPPTSIQRTCASAGTVRGADGAWIWDQAKTLACYRDQGWAPTGQSLGGIPSWRRI